MAIQPTQPQQNNRLGKFLMIGGAVAGGAVAGPGAAATLGGIATGAGAGSAAGGLIQTPQSESIESQGMARRMQQINQDPFRALSEAQSILQNLPSDQLPETRRAFEQALAYAQRNQQLGAGGYA